MKFYPVSKPYLMISLLMICMLLVQCSGSSSSDSDDTDDDILADANCTDIPTLKNLLTAQALSATSGETDEDSDVEIIVCVTEDDVDGDTITDSEDNCISTWNFSQTDTDNDGFGDSCDNCASVANETQLDTDQDGTGDECDEDTDNDGISNEIDNCETIYNPGQTNSDGDSEGDICDDAPTDSGVTSDADGDGVGDDIDNCPDDSNAYLNENGSYTYITDYQWDTDGDGIGNACDTDIDDDLLVNTVDDCDYNIRSDCGGTDTDADGITDDFDNCDAIANPGQEDIDDDDIGSACDDDESIASEEVVVDEIEDSDTTSDPSTDDESEEVTPTATTEVCNDNLDNDLDGLEDCDDTSCKEESYCDFDGDDIINSSDDDKDGDGLQNNHDLCAFHLDEWWVVPVHWVIVDSNGVADGDDINDDEEMFSVIILAELFNNGGDLSYIKRDIYDGEYINKSDISKTENYNTSFNVGSTEYQMSEVDIDEFWGTIQFDKDGDGVGDACDTGIVLKAPKQIDTIIQKDIKFDSIN